MSLARLALRLAAFQALCPEETIETGPWPTIAGPRVYDSRIDLIQSDEQIALLEGKPILVVYTEEDMASPQGTVARFPPDEQIVHLVVEAFIGAKGEVEVEQKDGTTMTFGTLTAPVTDRQHEALLDVLEALVRRLLDKANRAPGAELYSKVAFETHRIESVPQRADDRVTRMAARTIKFFVKVQPDKWPKVPAAPAPTGFDLLPEPLRTVAKALPAGSTGAILCQQIVGLLQQPAPLVPLQSIGFVTDVGGGTVESVVATDPAAPSPPEPIVPSP